MKISQREARRMRKELSTLRQALESQRRTWSQEYFGGVHIASVVYANGSDTIPTAVRTARKLNHAVVVIGDDGGTLRLMALPHPKVTA